MDDSLSQDHKDRMLTIAGVGQETLLKLEFDSALWGAWEKTRKTVERIACNINREGDGRVPLASATLEDVTMRYVKGQHGGLPNIPAVARDVVAWMCGDALRLSETCRGALGAHLSAEDDVTASPLLDVSIVSNRFRELPEFERPTVEFRSAIAAELDAGKMPQINLVKVF